MCYRNCLQLSYQRKLCCERIFSHSVTWQFGMLSTVLLDSTWYNFFTNISRRKLYNCLIFVNCCLMSCCIVHNTTVSLLLVSGAHLNRVLNYYLPNKFSSSLMQNGCLRLLPLSLIFRESDRSYDSWKLPKTLSFRQI